MEYNNDAKAELQKRIANQTVRLEYREEKPMVEDKGTQRFLIGLHLTGWGFEKKFLGRGEGQNKVEAGNRAAMDAMVSSKEVVEECERMFAEHKETRRVERERAEMVAERARRRERDKLEKLERKASKQEEEITGDGGYGDFIDMMRDERETAAYWERHQKAQLLAHEKKDGQA